MEKMKKLFDRVLEVSCIALMSVMTILVTYQVITRYIFNKPSAVSEVLARYMFVWMVLLCAAYVFGLREHMNIPFVKDKLPPRGRIVCDIAGEIIIALFGLGVMAAGATWAQCARWARWIPPSRYPWELFTEPSRSAESALCFIFSTMSRHL